MDDSLADGDYLIVKRGQVYDLSDAAGRSNAFRQILALMRSYQNSFRPAIVLVSTRGGADWLTESTEALRSLLFVGYFHFSYRLVIRQNGKKGFNHYYFLAIKTISIPSGPC